MTLAVDATDLTTDLAWRGDPAELVAELDRDAAHRAFVAAIFGSLPEWRRRAACTGVEPDVFFPRRGESSAICAGCPVRVECLTEALEYDAVEDRGIRGGTSAAERRSLRRRGKGGSDFHNLEGGRNTPPPSEYLSGTSGHPDIRQRTTVAEHRSCTP